MAIASVEGFISFVNASKDGTLSKLYKEEKAPPTGENTKVAVSPVVADRNVNKPAPVEAKATTRTARRRNKIVELKSFSRAALEAEAEPVESKVKGQK